VASRENDKEAEEPNQESSVKDFQKEFNVISRLDF